MNTTTEVYATTRFPALHWWPAAPYAVSHLALVHRHVFHVKLNVKVNHPDRDVEFISLRDTLANYVRKKYAEQPASSDSCEMMADNIIAAFIHWGFTVVSCEVSEDGENGAIVTVTEPHEGD